MKSKKYHAHPPPPPTPCRNDENSIRCIHSPKLCLEVVSGQTYLTAQVIFLWTSCTLWANVLYLYFFFFFFLCVWVEVLWPSQPNGFMSSTVSLPYQTFTGHASSSKQLTSIVHILLPVTDNFPSWISGRERMPEESMSWLSPRKNADPARVEPTIYWSPVGRASNWATEAGIYT